MAEKERHYPVTTLHDFLHEASDEFKRFRLQATVNLIGAIFLIAFLLRYTFLLYETAPLRGLMSVPLYVDAVLLVLALAVVLWSLDIWRRQHGFISRWGKRFEKLEAMENQLFPEETPQHES
jgi:hypothetical protein